MRRRTLLRRVGAASTAGAAGAVGTSAGETDESAELATARGMTIVWTAPDGTTERIAAEAFDRRADTPPLAVLDPGPDGCCDCPDPTVCRCVEHPPCTA